MQNFLFSQASCAAGTSIPTMVSLGTLARTATGGRRERRRILLVPRLPFTTSALMLLVWFRRLARITATSVSPSAA